MRYSIPSRRISIVTLALTLIAAGPAVAGSRYGVGDGAVQIRLGAFFPDGDSRFWTDNEDVFTLAASDFDSFSLGLGLVYSIHNNLEAGIHIDFYEETVLSRYRDPIPGFPEIIPVDSNGFPILHDTELSMVPVTFDVRWLPAGRYRIRGGGRRVAQPVFYVGAGAGLNFWEYEEFGDFLDFTFDPPDIIFDRFRDSGTAFQAHALAGVELPLGQRTNLLIEARYTFAEDDLGDDFAGLGELDLSGANAYAGLSFRF